MRILHTADWHLGCKTDDLDRLPEQRTALKQLIKIAKDKEVDMVIIAGDIYDSFVPSSEAEDLFYKTIKELNNNGNTMVVAIAGNHDDPKRLGNANIFANNYGIFLLGQVEEIPLSEPMKNKNIYPINSGRGYIEFEKQNGERIILAYLPYPSYYRFNESRKEGVSFNDKVKEWFTPGLSAFRGDTINIATSHLMCYNIKLSPEEFELYSTVSNNLNYINNEVLHSDAHYTALGHIHKCIPVNRERNIHYSGSLINQFFGTGEQLTKVIVVDLDKTGVTRLEKVPLVVKLLKRFTVSSILQADIVCRDNSEDWIKVIIENVDSVSIEEIKRLRSTYKNLVTLSVITKEAKQNVQVVSKKNLTNSEIFDNFVMRMTNSSPAPELKELFLELMSEELYETD